MFAIRTLNRMNNAAIQARKKPKKFGPAEIRLKVQVAVVVSILADQKLNGTELETVILAKVSERLKAAVKDNENGILKSADIICIS